MRSLTLGARRILVQNRVLAGLPRKDYRRLLPLLESVQLAFGQVPLPGSFLCAPEAGSPVVYLRPGAYVASQ